jgi:paired amphipathic helix protein Sin3a
MDNLERTYSPGKPSDVYQLGNFHSILPGSDPPQPVHSTIALQVGYPVGIAVSGTTSRPPLSAYSGAPVHMHAPPPGAFHVPPVGPLHVQPPAAGPLHIQPPQHAAALAIQPTVTGAVHGSQSHTVTMHASTMPSSLVSQAQLAQMCPWVPNMTSGSFGSTDLQLSQTSQQQQQQFQRLKVEDALSYLDQVKLQFSGQPQVYNDFLDIMKEFKSQSIDTPGVIKRVSTLFRGHSDLIVGFNTFLPPGYKIAVDANETICFQQPGQQAISLPIYQTTPPVQQPPVKPLQLTNSDVHAGRSELMSSTQPIGLSSGLPPVAATAAGTASSSSGQPVEFNHAIQYVNKIKLSYQNQPEVYKSFLDILHKYQKEQKMLKEGTPFPPGYRPLTEVEVYGQVTNLFKDQPQLLNEFSQFLPDANGSSSLMGGFSATESALARMRSDIPPTLPTARPPAVPRTARTPLRTTSAVSTKSTYQPVTKKPKLSVMSSVGTALQRLEPESPAILADLSFFDKVRNELGSHDYADVIRCIELYTKRVVSATELSLMLDPYMGKMPELRERILDLVKERDEDIGGGGSVTSTASLKEVQRHPTTDWKSSYVIDLSTCKEEGVSYRLLPKSYVQPVCSGRTKLCDEVLNDTYVLHPSWPEDLSSLSAYKKNQYEEHMYQCEDERYELDMVLELNSMTKTALSNVMAKLKKLTCPDDVARFRLDDSLGANSDILMRLVISRLYGDKTCDVIEGLKCNPNAAVPIVLRRLSAKEKEWRAAQHSFNRIWREQNERYYLKSLDHQAAKFKQTDVKHIRSKSLLKEIEMISKERHEADSAAESATETLVSPHMTLICHDSSVLADAASLIMHHLRRQSGLQAEDRSRARHVLYHIVPALLNRSQPLPAVADVDAEDEAAASGGLGSTVKREAGTGNGPVSNGVDKTNISSTAAVKVKGECEASDSFPNRTLVVFYSNDNWYFFIRLYSLLCERLKYFHQVAAQLAVEEAHYRPLRSMSVTEALKLRNPNAIAVDNSYSCFLELVRSLLDNNLDLGSFEDQLRDIFGIHAYVSFTIDKLIQNVGRQLQHIASKDVCWRLADLFESTVGQHGGTTTAELDYQHKAEEVIGEDNCFKIVVDVDKMEMTIELVEAIGSSSSSLMDDQSLADNASVDEGNTEFTKKCRSLPRNLRRVFARKDKNLAESRGHANSHETDLVPSSVQLVNAGDSTKEHDIMYMAGSLGRAKQKHRMVSCHMEAKFRRWRENWRHTNITETMSTQFSEWLLGHVDGLKPGLVTVLHNVTDVEHRPPYHDYVKYTVVSQPAVLALTETEISDKH